MIWIELAGFGALTAGLLRVLLLLLPGGSARRVIARELKRRSAPMKPAARRS